MACQVHSHPTVCFVAAAHMGYLLKVGIVVAADLYSAAFLVGFVVAADLYSAASLVGVVVAQLYPPVHHPLSAVVKANYLTNFHHF